MIAVCIPTRGIVYTEVMQGVVENCTGREWTLLTTIDEGLPECMNHLADRALDSGADWLWIVEEDTVPPPGVLDAMLNANVDYIAVDYPLGDGHTCIGFTNAHAPEVAWTGLGCTLIRASVFSRISRPYFACTGNLTVVKHRGLAFFTPNDKPNTRGGHDLYLGKALRAAGVTLHVLPDVECRHIKMNGWNAQPANIACHDIKQVPAITRPWTDYISSGPVCSIVIPCYKQAHWLPDAIESALAQTLPCEVIVVDDGSPDGTSKVVRRYPDVVLVSQRNKGLSAARNAGIRAATCDYILPLDADDKLTPDAVERMLAASTGGIVRSHMQEFGDTDQLVKLPSGTTLSDFMSGNRACCASMFMRKAWEAVGGYDDDMTDGFEDWDMWVRMVAHGATVATVDAALLLYRKHGDSLVTHATNNRGAIMAYMRAKWERMGITRLQVQPPLRYPIRIGAAITVDGTTYEARSRIDRATAVKAKAMGQLTDARIV